MRQWGSEAMGQGATGATWRSAGLGAAVLSLVLLLAPGPAAQADDPSSFNDSHFHLTNYIQEGTDIQDFLTIMGNRVGRSAVFGIPLQQQWSYASIGDARRLTTSIPTLRSTTTPSPTLDREQYLSLPKDQQARFDPMITGFNPADMYAADHIRRVLQTFPGVFTGIGEFTIHKEFVSAKIAGERREPARSRARSLLDFAGEVGLS